MRHPHAKLTVEQVLEIRRLAGTVTQEQLGEQFGVDASCVNQIIHRDTWRWLEASAQAIALLLVLVAAAGASTVHGYESDGTYYPTIQEIFGSCDIAVGAFLNPGTQPRKDCDYPLNSVVVYQKVKNGYLLSGDFELGGEEPGLIFLKTPVELTKGMRFNNERVHPSGTYDYEGIDGFTKRVWAFEVVKP